MIRKTLFITSFIFVITLIILLILTFYITETKKDEIEKYAIEFAIKKYEVEKSKLKENSLVNIGLEILEKYEPNIKNKLSKTDTIISNTLATINQGDIEFLKELEILDKKGAKENPNS